MHHWTKRDKEVGTKELRGSTTEYRGIATRALTVLKLKRRIKVLFSSFCSVGTVSFPYFSRSIYWMVGARLPKLLVSSRQTVQLNSFKTCSSHRSRAPAPWLVHSQLCLI